jgi:3-deoxy-D-manno-octulosonate 8-phosphate phosphatase KdsC-like HAD superfamily phosphatase
MFRYVEDLNKQFKEGLLLKTPGGQGTIREVADEILKSK